MGREIKFRAWSFEYNRFLDCETPQLWNYLDGYANPVHRSLDYKTIVVQQFTGALDRSGKEIYEGDILKMSTGHVYDGVHQYETGEVHFDLNSFAVKVGQENSHRSLWLMSEGGEYEVIGNTHEKPDPDAVYDFERGAWRLGQIYYQPKRPSFTLEKNKKD